MCKQIVVEITDDILGLAETHVILFLALVKLYMVHLYYYKINYIFFKRIFGLALAQKL
jgi:hypothetical protein